MKLPDIIIAGMQTICFYEKDAPYYEFSNYYACAVNIDGKIWPTTEHYYQAAKFNSAEYREIIRAANTPYKAFILGRMKKKGGFAANYVLGGDPVGISGVDKYTPLNTIIDKYAARADPVKNWDYVKEAPMRKALRAKFTQHKDLAAMLEATGNAEIIENSPRDEYWGQFGGIGKNRLGFLLMELRQELRE